MTRTHLIFECGQSAIRMQLITGNETIASGTGPGVFYQSDGTVQAIINGINGSLNGLDSSKITVDTVALCSSGLPTLTQQLNQIAEYLRQLVNPQHIYLAGDDVGWHLGATGGEPGIVASLGTGTVISVLNEQREFSVVDGWGYLLGDHGSAFEIGRMALAHCTRAFDRESPPDYLTNLIIERFGSVDSMVRHTYSHPHLVNEIAQYAQYVVAGAREGDAACHHIIRTAAQNLATSIEIAANRMNSTHQIPLILVGGLMKGSDVLTKPLSDALRSNRQENTSLPIPDLRITPPQGDALAGAKILAQAAQTQKVEPYLTRVTSYTYN